MIRKLDLAKRTEGRAGTEVGARGPRGSLVFLYLFFFFSVDFPCGCQVRYLHQSPVFSTHKSAHLSRLGSLIRAVRHRLGLGGRSTLFLDQAACSTDLAASYDSDRSSGRLGDKCARQMQAQSPAGVTTPSFKPMLNSFPVLNPRSEQEIHPSLGCSSHVGHLADATRAGTTGNTPRRLIWW